MTITDEVIRLSEDDIEAGFFSRKNNGKSQHKDSYYLAASRLSVAGGLQPGVFRKIFQDPEDAQGLQARFLFARPLVQPAKRVKGY